MSSIYAHRSDSRHPDAVKLVEQFRASAPPPNEEDRYRTIVKRSERVAERLPAAFAALIGATHRPLTDLPRTCWVKTRRTLAAWSRVSENVVPTGAFFLRLRAARGRGRASAPSREQPARG